MLEIGLLILKIIGICLAALLALVVLLVLALLFVPVKYDIKASYYDSVPKAEVKLSAMMKLVRFRLVYEEALKYKVKVLFFTVYSSEKNGREDEDGEEKRNAHSKKKSKKRKSSKETRKEENVFDTEDADDSTKSDAKAGKPASGDDRTDSGADGKEEQRTQAAAAKTEVKPESDGDGGADEPDEETEEKEYFFAKLYHRVTEVWECVKQKLAEIKQKLVSVLESVRTKKEDASEKIQSLYDTVHDEENRAFVRFLWEQLKILLRALKPKKGRLYLHYGMEDPETTGKIAMYLAVLYGWLGMDIKILPDFEQKVMEGEVFLKGGLRLWSVLVITLRVYRNRQFKKLVLKK